MKFLIIIFILTVCLWIPNVIGAKILAFFPPPIYSHLTGFHSLFEELANRGHNITVVSPFPPKQLMPPTYTHKAIANVNTVKIKKHKDPMKIRHIYRLLNMLNVKLRMTNLIKETLELDDVRSFLNDTRFNFDVVLTECWYSDVYLAVGHRYSAPVICLSPMLPTVGQSNFLDMPINPAYIPSFWMYYSDTMCFMERLVNFIVTSAEILTDYIIQKLQQTMLDDLYEYPGHHICPSLNTLKKKIALTFVNSHFSVSYSRPYPPNMIPVAGMHLRPQKLIEQGLMRLLDNAVEGFIFFSFGSNIKMTSIPEHQVKVFIDSFKKLPQLILWKWENGTIDGIPGNIHMDKWFPQQFILNHKNCKLFITHGGYHSLVEAIHYGLPIIGFPFYTDQFYNMKFAVEKGFGIEMSLDKLNENVLDNALEQILLNQRLKNNAQKISVLLSDLPKATSLNTAVYWVEYVIRNGQGPQEFIISDLNWFQYWSIDVVLFVFSILFFIIFVLLKLICCYIGNNK
ncbi:UDP-glycosyltransferase UGT4-like isoform X2 [Adelges cooleyi]|uniref:UDP-glycosyltransferase UGT4-like isoform X2 n=1 Tax=Adelges cooleyi TaxID=133065 RepID=UPI00218011B9|nr:UDP-glycosyltransferase UGT4-like isoform X2 [Adelges cooleyi]